MKCLTIFLALLVGVVLISAEKLTKIQESILFGDYLKRFNIRGGRSRVQQENFIRNYYNVEEHNEGYRNGTKSYNQTVNQFSHLREKEFSEKFTGSLPDFFNATVSPFGGVKRGRLTTPSYWSWLDVPNIVGPVTYQAQCGSCTIFATLGVIETHMRISFGLYTKLSEQEAMQCCGGCNGGSNSYVYDYARNGAAYDSDLKYAGKVLGPCNKNRPRVPGSKVDVFYKILSGSNAATDAMWHLVNVGPLATRFCLPSRSFHNYASGVYDDEDFSSCYGHAVLVVGYGTEGGKPYWLIRNSWGTGWGDKGYIKMLRGKNLCQLENSFTYPKLRL